MVEFMREYPRAGLVGPRLVAADGTTQASASELPGLRMQLASFLGLRRLVPRRTALALAKTPGLRRVVYLLTAGYLTPALSGEAAERAPRRVGFLSGACVMARREMWQEIGLLDDRIFLFLEDADWCRRAGEAGWELWYLPELEVVHLGGESFRVRSGGRSHHISRERCSSLIYYFEKHEPPWKVGLLRYVVRLSLGVRLMSLVVRRLTRQVDAETYATDATLLKDTLQVARH
jgi:GT2 family glycosyltransferase